MPPIRWKSWASSFFICCINIVNLILAAYTNTGLVFEMAPAPVGAVFFCFYPRAGMLFVVPCASGTGFPGMKTVFAACEYKNASCEYIFASSEYISATCEYSFSKDEKRRSAAWNRFWHAIPVRKVRWVGGVAGRVAVCRIYQVSNPPKPQPIRAAPKTA